MNIVKSNGRTTVTINGKTKTYEGSISIINGKVLVNGKPVEDFKNDDSRKDNRPIIINITGDVEKIEDAAEVHVTGNVKGNIDAYHSVHVEKDCYGDIDAAGTVTVGGNCQNIDTNGPVTVGGNCKDIDTNGNVTVNGNCAGDIDTIGSVHVGSNKNK